MEAIAQKGSAGFYQGAVAEEIGRFCQANGGLLTEEDLAAHKGEWVEPIQTDYKGVTLYEIPPNGQGITALMALNILENAKLEKMEHLSTDYIHTVVEAYKLAMAERDRYVADPAFGAVPVEAMLNKAFGKTQFDRIQQSSALPHPLPSALGEHKDTVYLTVVDKDRNACSFINSLFHNFGSGVVAGETGVMLQNRGSGFLLQEGHPNCIAPGKRPFHTIIPAMAYRDGNPILSYGVMGGYYQPMGHLYVLSNWLDFGMDIQEAIDAPRFLPGEGVLTLEHTIPEATRSALTQRGHQVAVGDLPFGGGQAIYIDAQNGVLHAGSDPRKDGCALGY